MSATFQLRPALLMAACALALGACTSVNNATRDAFNAVTPYKIEVVQGNFVSKEQMASLQKDMTRQQVRGILGTPLLTDIFHNDRWDYVFSIKRQGVEPQRRKLTVWFEGDRLARFEGDEMPTEQEFVAAVDARGLSSKDRDLDMKPEKIKELDESRSAKADKTKAADSAPMPALPASYPPLEAR